MAGEQNLLPFYFATKYFYSFYKKVVAHSFIMCYTMYIKRKGVVKNVKILWFT